MDTGGERHGRVCRSFPTAGLVPGKWSREVEAGWKRAARPPGEIIHVGDDIRQRPLILLDVTARLDAVSPRTAVADRHATVSVIDRTCRGELRSFHPLRVPLFSGYDSAHRTRVVPLQIILYILMGDFLGFRGPLGNTFAAVY